MSNPEISRGRYVILSTPSDREVFIFADERPRMTREPSRVLRERETEREREREREKEKKRKRERKNASLLKARSLLVTLC